MKPMLVVITGPTGAGKTDLAVELARRFGAPIISADSRQIYRGMAIGTAQPSPGQLAAAPHYMIADHDITDGYSCGDFEHDALALLRTLMPGHPVVLAVGGSGLYIDALCNGMDELPAADAGLREELDRRLRDEGLDALWRELHALDPEYAGRVDRHNPRRIIRALEVCRTAGLPYSALRRGRRAVREFDIVKIGVTLDRPALYGRIDSRVDRMVADGLADEARLLYPHRNLNALRTVGYRELFDHFDGTTTFEQAVELIKRNSRRYAKRQLTWLARDPDIAWFGPDGADAVAEYIKDKVR